jgi:ubiquinone biosynthesis protein COQ9
MLGGVYGATLLYWLSDSSLDSKDTWGFLDARIEDVMGLEKLRMAASETLSKLPSPLDLIAGLRR